MSIIGDLGSFVQSGQADRVFKDVGAVLQDVGVVKNNPATTVNTNIGNRITQITDSLTSQFTTSWFKQYGLFLAGGAILLAVILWKRR